MNSSTRAAEAKSQHLHFAVDQRNRSELHAEQFERAINFFQRDAGHAAQFWFSIERIREGAPHDFKRLRISVDRHGLLLADAKRTQIVETHNVIGVAVG